MENISVQLCFSHNSLIFTFPTLCLKESKCEEMMFIKPQEIPAKKNCLYALPYQGRKMAKISYRDSHKLKAKVAEYEACYQNNAWNIFLCSREQKIVLRILDKYLKGRDVHLLDFACGTGRITKFLEDRVETSTGVDVSNSMLAVAGKKLKKTELIKADITEENILKPGKFNLITAFRFFLNAEPELRSAAIKALAELLDEDGYLVFNNHQNSGSPWVKMRNLYHRKYSQLTYNVMSIEQMVKLVEEAGLEIIEIYPTGFFHPPRIPVSFHLSRAIDLAAGKFKFLNRFSENTIAVCRWKKNHKSQTPTIRK
jgi:ubiquinone/menaquinone biosynthesis C-methylase UbiE